MRLLAFPLAEGTGVSGQVDLYSPHDGPIRPAAERVEGAAARPCMGLGFSRWLLVWRSRAMSEGKPPLVLLAGGCQWRLTDGGRAGPCCSIRGAIVSLSLQLAMTIYLVQRVEEIPD